jgi:hypothetical protein
MPEPSPWATSDWNDPWQAPWTLDALRTRGYDTYGVFDEPDTGYPSASEDEPEPVVRRRSAHSLERAMGAIADAMGVDVADLDDDIDLDTALLIIDNDLDDPQSARDALDSALERRRDEKARPGQSDGAYIVKEGNWRQRMTNGRLPRIRKHLPPSRTPEARRRRHLQGLVDAGKYRDLATAERMTQRRGGNKPARPGGI